MIDVMQWLATLAVCTLRPLGVMMLLPLFSRKSLGGVLVRNALVILIALPLLPIYQNLPILTEPKMLPFAELMLREIFIGLCIGFSAAIPFWAIDVAGFIIDTMRGASMSTVYNPLLGTQASVFGILFNQVLTVLFLVTGGFNKLLDGIYISYTLLPLGNDLELSKDLFNFLSHEWHLMFDLAISFALPAMVIMLLVDLALGLINRSAQQLNVFFLSMPIKSAMAILLILLSLNFSFGHFLQRINLFEHHIQDLVFKMSVQ
ncbi:type III secretion system export apparatus subunit SctT [Vibrio sp. S4M6]|uniref:type III secretion system export apparatus subunit SctT n=1 Tax=Vibrio sinus TaxID=2946865 RepID=UPI00202A49EE|nr:type III secretion system export apparatus subunit SctT [Vibrio sinus]MCL9783719.1 type III secretion system export apparatus subunit SctT [Vibrio sinus]